MAKMRFVIFAVLAFSTVSYALKCQTCRGKSCDDSKKIRLVDCEPQTNKLPYNFQSKSTSLIKHACVDLKYVQENLKTLVLRQCQIVLPKENLCKEIEKQLPKSVQLEKCEITTEDKKSEFKIEIYFPNPRPHFIKHTNPPSSDGAVKGSSRVRRHIATFPSRINAKGKRRTTLFPEWLWTTEAWPWTTEAWPWTTEAWPRTTEKWPWTSEAWPRTTTSQPSETPTTSWPWTTITWQPPTENPVTVSPSTATPNITNPTRPPKPPVVPPGNAIAIENCWFCNFGTINN